MAVRRRGARVAGRLRGDKHGWLALDRYISIHRANLEDRPFVLGDDTQFAQFEGRVGTVVECAGVIHCALDVIVLVRKLMRARSVRGRLEVFTVKYSYQVRQKQGGRMHELLRYDNGHPGAPEEYHRHEYDGVTGAAALRVMSRQEFPTLAECLDEIADLVGFADKRGA